MIHFELTHPTDPYGKSHIWLNPQHVTAVEYKQQPGLSPQWSIKLVGGLSIDVVHYKVTNILDYFDITTPE